MYLEKVLLRMQPPIAAADALQLSPAEFEVFKVKTQQQDVGTL